MEIEDRLKDQAKVLTGHLYDQSVKGFWQWSSSSSIAVHLMVEASLEISRLKTEICSCTKEKLK